MIPVLAVSACTEYRPLGQGARVPWAEALSKGSGGPIGASLYRVGEGDALSLIAERYGLPVANLAVVNNIEPPYILYPGEVLRIPPGAAPPNSGAQPTAKPPAPIVETALPPPNSPEPGSDQQRAERERPRWTPQERPPEQTQSPPPRNDVAGKRHKVSPGESLSVIAERNGLSLGDLVTANGIEPPYRLRSGQVLIIPPSEADRRRPRPSAPRVSGNGLADALAPPPPLSGQGFLWPVRGRVISTFEENAAKGRSGGITISAPRGTVVRAADNGIVAYAGEALRGYGRMILLRHAEGYVTLYAHNDSLLVDEGDIVRRGQAIAEVGASGDVSESQLHFELRKGAEPIDPARVLAGSPGRQFSELH